MYIKRYENFDFEEDFEEDEPTNWKLNWYRENIIPISEVTKDTPIGTRVIFDFYHYKIPKGYKGTLIHKNGLIFGIDFDKDILEHNCHGKGRMWHCWNFSLEN